MTLQRKTPLKRSAWGEKKRVAVQSEDAYSRTWEQLMQLHRLDFWHDFRTDKRSIPGYPDYTVLGNGWHAWVEVKARSLATGRIGKVAPAQRRYQQAIEKAGGEWQTFCFPDDWEKAEEWLITKTGIIVRGFGRSQPVEIGR